MTPGGEPGVRRACGLEVRPRGVLSARGEGRNRRGGSPAGCPARVPMGSERGRNRPQGRGRGASGRDNRVRRGTALRAPRAGDLRSNKESCRPMPPERRDGTCAARQVPSPVRAWLPPGRHADNPAERTAGERRGEVNRGHHVDVFAGRTGPSYQAPCRPLSRPPVPVRTPPSGVPRPIPGPGYRAVTLRQAED